MKIFKIILVLFLVFATLDLFSSGCKKEQAPQIKHMAESKKFLLIIAPTDFQDKEYSDTREALEKAGVLVSVASLKTGEARGKFGKRVNVDLSVDDVKLEDYNGVAFIGGPGMVDLVSNPKFIDLAKKFYQSDKITAAICIAPLILSNAGILKEKKATVWPSAEKELKKGGCVYTGRPVEVDGKVITGNGPDAAAEFGRKIVEMLFRE
jgi:protease I